MRLHMAEEEIAVFVKDGADPSERVHIAAQMNCCSISVIKEICERNGVHIRAAGPVCGRKPWPPAKVERLRALATHGKTQAEIAKDFGVTNSAISYQMKKYNIQLPRKKKLRDSGNHPGAAEENLLC